MEPWLHQTAKDFAGKVKVVSVDFDKSPDLVEEYSVEGPPTLVLMRGNEEVGRVVGPFKDEILSMLGAAL